MSFKELFEKYKDGTASQEEIKEVESEIEKNELINEYLAEQIELQLSNDLIHEENINAETSKVKKAVNKKLYKVVGLSVSIVITLLLLFNYVGLPLINSYYYNPNKGYNGQFIGQFFLDTAAFTELHFPGLITSSATAESLGFGKYNIEIRQDNMFKRDTLPYQGKIVRNKVENFSDGFYKFPYANAFHDASVLAYKQDKWDYDNTLKELEKLPETSYVSAYISFKEDLTLDEFVDLKKNNAELYFSWVAVRYTSKGGWINSQMGFEPTGNGLVIEEEAIDNDRYPCFELANCIENLNNLPAETLETHFKTLVKYMGDRSEFTEAFSVNDISPKLYEDALAYVEENGVKPYGVLVQGPSSDILKFAKSDIVNSISIDDVKASRYAK